jgi:alpha-tubulin suppressor-like RCC1 family protein
VNDTELWADVEAGGFHSLAINANGDLFTCGKNNKGQCGNQTSTAVVFPFENVNESNVTDIAGGYDHSVVIINNGGSSVVQVTGSNAQAQLPINGSNGEIGFYPISAAITNAKEVEASPYTTFIYNHDGVLFISGQLGADVKSTLEILHDLMIP